ncbi:MAG TPA: hypothetical protein VLM19_04990 [Nitrospiraceae bacterium]|nr:hypothetical protein [Nitrospiraceae bacterium]
MVTVHGILLAAQMMDRSCNDHDSCIGNPNRRRVNGIVIFLMGAVRRETGAGFPPVDVGCQDMILYLVIRQSVRLMPAIAT